MALVTDESIRYRTRPGHGLFLDCVLHGEDFNMKKILITGASGLFGRELFKTFQDSGWDVLGLAYTRAKGNLRKVDLTDSKAIQDVIMGYQPDVVIHAAAERRTDVVERDPQTVQKLNVGATAQIAAICEKLGILLVYISTNYVFDGTKPPYKPSDEPNPLNKYGQSKRDGEIATLKNYPGAVILRLPLLYGSIERLNESAATYLLHQIQDTSKVLELCDYQQRRPTHVRDVASVVIQLAQRHCKGEGVSGILHWNTSEQLTRYQMALIITDIFKLPMDHLIPNPNPPSTGTPRPQNATMDISIINALGVKVTDTPFRKGIEECLTPHLS
ncbi:methionine adenosyltransferase 2 subunit beta-like isoform X1 [Lytechinus pictus]|uniref:methionine adenosyltransferase 2 subunit beta-like isoform X1 n=2 Tax=Lytechinus pictus TaxID=7653 RepID=UPI0030B9C846